MLVGKPGLDGHSNGAEQIAVAARDSGIEVVYEGIRLTPARIANAAREEGEAAKRDDPTLLGRAFRAYPSGFEQITGISLPKEAEPGPAS